MRLEWLKDQDNVVYVEKEKFVDNFAMETGIPGLRKAIEDFAADPQKEGLNLKGTKRTSLKLFIPDIMFGEKIDMGENVWLYMGEQYPAYCVYELRSEDCGVVKEGCCECKA